MENDYTMPTQGEPDLCEDRLALLYCEQHDEAGGDSHTFLTNTPFFLTSPSPRILRHFDPSFSTLNAARFTKYSFTKMRFFHERAIALVNNFTNVHFLTLTFPGSTEDAVATSFNVALDALKALLADMKKWNEHKAITHVVCFEHSVDGQLHLHMLLDIPLAHQDIFTVENIRTSWAEILSELSWLTGVPLCESSDGCIWDKPEDIQVDMESVRKPLSAASYLTKLTDLKTGPDCLAKAPYVTSAGEIISTARWATCSRNLKALVVREQLSLSFPVHSLEHGLFVIDAELIPLVDSIVDQSLNWTDHINGFTKFVIGRRCWIKLENLSERKRTSLKHKLKQLAQGRRRMFQGGAAKSMRCHLDLGLGGRLCVRLSSSAQQ